MNSILVFKVARLFKKLVFTLGRLNNLHFILTAKFITIELSRKMRKLIVFVLLSLLTTYQTYINASPVQDSTMAEGETDIDKLINIVIMISEKIY